MYDVVTIGTATRDVFLRSTFFKVLRDPKHLRRLGFQTGEAQCLALGGKLEVGAPVLTLGGGALNAAVTFARRGLRAAALVKIGKDPNGEAVLRDLKQEKISPLIRYDQKQMTAYSVVLLSPGGERTILHHRGASEDLTTSEANFKNVRTKWIYVNPGRIPYKVIKKIIFGWSERGALVAMNPSAHYLKFGVKKLAPLLKKVSVLILNREEAAALTNVPYREERRIFKRLDELAPGVAVMTEGKRGVMVADGKFIYHAGTFKEKFVADRTGAGDAFGSAFVASLIKSRANPARGVTAGQIREAIRAASANATSVVEAIGAEQGILKSSGFAAPRWRNFKIDTRRA